MVELCAKQKNAPKIIYLAQRNQGQGRARMKGIKEAKGEIILLLGDDIIPANKAFLNEHLKFHHKHANKYTHVAVLGFTDWHPDIEINDF